MPLVSLTRPSTNNSQALTGCSSHVKDLPSRDNSVQQRLLPPPGCKVGARPWSHCAPGMQRADLQAHAMGHFADQQQPHTACRACCRMCHAWPVCASEASASACSESSAATEYAAPVRLHPVAPPLVQRAASNSAPPSESAGGKLNTSPSWQRDDDNAQRCRSGHSVTPKEIQRDGASEADSSNSKPAAVWGSGRWARRPIRNCGLEHEPGRIAQQCSLKQDICIMQLQKSAQFQQQLGAGEPRCTAT